MSFRRLTPFRLFAALLAVLSCASTARASEFSDDLKARRARVMEELGADALLILWCGESPLVVTARLDVVAVQREDSHHSAPARTGI